MPVRIAIFGTGGRGAEAYGGWILRHPDRAQVVAVAEPLHGRRDRFADRADVPAENRFPTWRALMAEVNRLDLDAVVVATPDTDHLEPAAAAAERGLAVLLEKPLARDEATLRELEQRLLPMQPRVAVCHVLRETPFWRSVHAVVASGTLGALVTIRHEENIGFWHFAHSYVRGNWRNVATSSPMALAKTSHDMDLLRWLAGAAPETVSSVGSLMHFRKENAPAGAPSHCVHGCPVADSCPFYAPRYYVERLANVDGWPVALLGDDVSREGRLRALAEGPYGRCVYRCDNDVADHQQTIFGFPGGLTASLSVSAFTGQNTRTFQVTGTRGELAGRMDTGQLRLQLFAPGQHELPDLGTELMPSTTGPMDHDVLEWVAAPPRWDEADHRGHAGGDDALTERFVTAVESGDFDAHVTTTLAASLDSHWMAFAAERARRHGEVVRLADVRPLDVSA
ncbi:Gfo/Idh/MocA family oxidoreductase [Georgenia sp. TF02-10]|uniref:Gfo/Idh/MocA family protein n=1 Tax=Georgenia sp. TF02-10 TaxID=2917725 RepID=UPI001FA79117|nr:Gfo/Idh/MocA family oxidoreductase [Georgenia sp. TF02-10]UNX53234.1 Gfo/Idh/MocA family oxidoreductase [Georgenia sp. TF02-10]